MTITVTFQLLWFFTFVYPCPTIVMDEGGFKCCFFFFFFFLYGYRMKLLQKPFNEGSKYSILLFVLSIVLFFTYKKMASLSNALMDGQVLCVPLLLFFVIISAKQVSAWLMRFSYPEWFRKGCIALSNLTLDIYIVQMTLIRTLMPQLPFPINIIVVFVLILCTAYINNKAASYISDKLNF